MDKRLKALNLNEKIELLSGKTFWTTSENSKINLRSLFLADGPHGLRKQEGSEDHLGLNASIKTTCFPTASNLASTWNPSLIKKIGSALGEEAKAIGIDVILGPGINLKRNPLCGRNFEYFSEDPLLTSTLACNWIDGVQSRQIGTSLKHFALNNQESERFVTNAVVDMRTLHEYYLAPFRNVVKKSQPYTIMCSYNKVNGQQLSTNKYLLNDVLRNQWGFKGMVVSDWGATCERPLAIKAGMDLEMPGNSNFFKKDILNALKRGQICEDDIDIAVNRLLELEKKIVNLKEPYVDDIQVLLKKNACLALTAAQQGAVLLKNENQLPLNKNIKVKVVGALAADFRYQGAGSSQVEPFISMNLLDGLKHNQINYNYYPGYTIDGTPSNQLSSDAIDNISKGDTIIFCMGLTPIYESEGYDREHMKLPINQLELLKAVARKTSNVIVLLVGGAPFEVEFDSDVSAILHMQLAGQMAGQAAADLLFGNVNPSGRLAETYPIKEEDLPNYHIYNKPSKFSPYLEGQYCGYRYFNTAKKPVKYPFGFGLSYSKFEYSGLHVKQLEDDRAIVEYTIENVSNIDGYETSQVYMSLPNKTIHRPSKVLTGFNKIFISAGEKTTVETVVDFEPLKIWDNSTESLELEKGTYQLEVSSNIEDTKLCETIYLEGKVFTSTGKSWYKTFSGRVTEVDFEQEYPRYKDLNIINNKFSTENSIFELKEFSFIAKKIFSMTEKQNAKQFNNIVDYNNPEFKMLMASSTCAPLRAMSLFSPKIFSRNMNKIIVNQANKKAKKVNKFTE